MNSNRRTSLKATEGENRENRPYMKKKKMLFTVTQVDENDGKSIKITLQIVSALTVFSRWLLRLLSVRRLKKKCSRERDLDRMKR